MIDDALALEPERAAWRRRITAASLLLLEALALFVLGNLVAAPAGRAGPGLPALLAAVLLGYGLARTLRHFDLPPKVLISAGIAVSLAGLWLLGSLQYSDGLFVDSGLVLMLHDPGRALSAHGAAVLGLIIIAIAWVRGALIGSWARVTQRAVLGSLTAGLVIAFLGLTFGQAARTAPATDAAALALFVCGLLALALLQLGLSEHIRGDSWRGPWLIMLLGTCAVLALAGASVGLLPLSLLNPVFAVLGGLLALMLDVVLYITVYPFALAITWLLIHVLAPHLHMSDVKIQLPPPPNPRQLRHPSQHGAGAAIALLLGRILLFVAIVGAILLVLLWLFRRVERESAVDAAEYEPLEIDNALGADLGELFAALKRKLRPVRSRPDPALSPRLRDLRRLYLRLLQRGEARGVERPPAATAREFGPQLEQTFTSPLPLELTDQFARGRYGQIEPAQAELDKLRSGLDRLR